MSSVAHDRGARLRVRPCRGCARATCARRFGARAALDGVSFDVAPGEVFGLLGPNGAGKTTAFRVLSGLLPPDGGAIALDGARGPPAEPGLPRAPRRRLSGAELDLKLTGARTCASAPRSTASAAPRPRAASTRRCALMELGARADEPTSTYSGGMRRRIEIARVLLHDPELLLLDEPGRGVDPEALRRIWDQLGALRRERADEHHRDHPPARGGGALRSHRGARRRARRADGHARRAARARRRRRRVACAATRPRSSPRPIRARSAWRRASPATTVVHRGAARPRARPAHRRAVRARAAAQRRDAPPHARRRVRQADRPGARRMSADAVPAVPTAGAPAASRPPRPSSVTARSSARSWAAICGASSASASRVVGSLAQPLILWLVLGAGLGGSFQAARRRRRRLPRSTSTRASSCSRCSSRRSSRRSR